MHQLYYFKKNLHYSSKKNFRLKSKVLFCAILLIAYYWYVESLYPISVNIIKFKPVSVTKKGWVLTALFFKLSNC